MTFAGYDVGFSSLAPQKDTNFTLEFTDISRKGLKGEKPEERAEKTAG